MIDEKYMWYHSTIVGIILKDNLDKDTSSLKIKKLPKKQSVLSM